VTSIRSIGALVVIALAGLIGCSDSGGHHGGGTSTGTLSVKATDAPPSLASLRKAAMTIERIEVHQEAAANSGFVTIFEGKRTIDLLDLRGGITETLIDAQLPAGTYRQVRLLITGGEVVMDVNGQQKTFSSENGLLTLTSADTSGLKLMFADDPIVVVGGLTSELLLDFDLSRSFNAIGDPTNPSSIQLQPVVRAVNASTAGTIAGLVSSIAGVVSGAEVAALRSGAVVATTSSDGQGVYALNGVPAGTYDVRFSAAGFQTQTRSEVVVVPANRTTVDVTLQQ
jgi:hypothetical protein